MSDTTCHRTAKPGDVIEISGIRFEVVRVGSKSAKVKITAPRDIPIRHLVCNGEDR